MRDLKKVLESLGLLHDAIVRRVTWVPEQGLLELEIADFFSNFEGLPEYPGRKSGSLFFRGVEHARIDLDMSENRLNVDELVIVESPEGKFKVSAKFWPNGHITASCQSASWPELPGPRPC